MMSSRNKQNAGGELRRVAEERLEGVEKRPQGSLETTALAKSMHELLVHQVELEMQNEELIEARAELEGNAELLAELYDFAPVGYFSLSAKGEIRQINLMGARMLGCERSRLLESSLANFVSPADRPAFGRFLSRVFACEDAGLCEVGFLSGGQLSVIASLTGALSPNGMVCRMAAMDVTAQRQVEAAVREKNDDLDRIFNFSHDLLAIAGNDGRFRRVNPAFERVLGYGPEVLTGGGFLRFVHPDDREATQREMQRLNAGEDVVDFVNRYVCADGSYRWLEWRVTPYAGGMMCALARDITARKEAENAFRESEGKLHLFIKHAPAGIAMFDREMRYLAASDRWKSDYGLEGNVRGRSHYELVPGIPERWKEMCRRGLAGETLNEEEDASHRSDGSVQWVKWSMRPWHASDGEVGGLLIVEEDVTARVHDREALLASERRLRLAIDAAKMGSWDWDLRTNEVLWTPYHEVIMGYEPGTPRRTFADFINRLHPDDARRVECCIRRAIDNRTDYSCDFRVVWPDASVHWVSNFGRLFHNSDGPPVRMLGMIMDVTGRKEAEEAIRQSEERFRSIVESSPTAIYLYQLGPDGQLVLIGANPAADKELGIEHRPMIGMTLVQAFPKLAETRVPEIYKAVATGDLGNQQFEIGFEGAGFSGYFEVHVFRTNPGTIAVMFSEISERKSAREAREKYQEQLEMRVERRTAQLHERTRQLRALADELTHAEERERGRIAGLIHEDFQQMLVAALLNLEILKAKAADAETARGFTQIEGILRDSIRAARSLTAELSPPVLQQCGLAAALRWLRTWCGEKYAMDVVVEVDDEVDPGTEVGVSLFRCVRELLFNVVKHAGVRNAALRMWRTDDDQLRIGVSDEGSGFDPEEVRAREGSVGSFGLFSIRERLEWLGGGLEIDSSPGCGSRFTLWVPLKTGSMESAGL